MLNYYCGTGWAESKRAKLDMGADAYLCCPGPSLKKINPDTIKGKGRIVFGINTSYPYVKPDIWMGMDTIECYDRNILYEPFMKIFRAPFATTMKFGGKFVKEYPNVYWTSVDKPKDGETMYNRRAHSSHIVWHKSTLMAAIHTMIWMGAKNIHLAGCDMGGNQDYWYGNTLNREQKKYNHRLYKTQVEHLKQIVELGKTKGVNFYSITPNSPINEFMPYLEPEEAIKRSETKATIEEDWEIKHVLDTKKTTVVTMYKRGVAGPDYVYRLKEAIDKYLPRSKFVCLTDEKLEGIETLPIRYDWGHMVWNKLELFEHFKERVLYIDATSIIKGDLTPLTKFKGFTMIADFVNPEHMSSAVMGWDGDYSYITEKFKSDVEGYKKLYAPYAGQVSGKAWKSCVDQKFIEDTVKDIQVWDEDLVASYKMSSKKIIDKAPIVKYHGSPKPHEVDWNIYRPALRNTSKGGNVIHVTNWAIWGGVQSVCLSIAKEYKEYNHHILNLKSQNQQEDCINNFKSNGLTYSITRSLKEDLKRLNPEIVFLHNTVPSSIGYTPGMFKGYKTVRVHHGGEIGHMEVDMDWFVSENAKSRNQSKTNNEFVLPPVVYTKDYLGIVRPQREPVVGRVQSNTYGQGSAYPPKFFELMSKIKAEKFIVGPKDTERDADIIAGKTPDYLEEMDIFAVWQDKVETWGLGATEANLSGIPVVVKKMNDGLTEQLQKSGGGILVNTEEEFINAINILVDNEDLRTTLGNKGREWCSQNVDTKLLREKLNGLLE